MKLTLLIAAVFASATALRVADPKATYNTEEAKACKASGGRYGRGGLAGGFTCVKNYKDAFKPCTSSDGCEGDCIVEDQYNPTAFCQPTDSKFGCWVTI